MTGPLATKVQRIPGDGVELMALVAGAGPLLLLLHGFPETPACWRPQLAALSATHCVVAPWQRGYGGSGRPAGSNNYRIERLCADIVAIADHFGAARFAVAGHDWGGIVAWSLAAAYPERVARLIVVNAPHPTLFQAALDRDAAQRAASAYMTALVDPRFEVLALADGGVALWDAVFGEHLRAGEITPTERGAMLADWQRPGTLTAMTDWYRAAPFTYPGVVPEPLGNPPPPRLSIAVPTTVIWGEVDTVLLPGLLDGLEALVPDLTIHRVAAGHGILRERPADVTRLIAAALNS